MRIHLQTSVHYECDGCGATAPALVESGITGDGLDISAHEDALRGVTHAARSAVGGNGDPDYGVPDAWLFINLPVGWRVTIARYLANGGRLRTWVTCSQDCVDRVLGRTPETKSAFIVDTAGEYVVVDHPLDHRLDYEWRRAADPQLGEDHLRHLFPIVNGCAARGALCDPSFRVRKGSLGDRVPNKWQQCSDCERLREGLSDDVGPDD